MLLNFIYFKEKPIFFLSLTLSINHGLLIWNLSRQSKGHLSGFNSYNSSQHFTSYGIITLKQSYNTKEHYITEPYELGWRWDILLICGELVALCGAGLLLRCTVDCTLLPTTAVWTAFWRITLGSYKKQVMTILVGIRNLYKICKIIILKMCKLREYKIAKEKLI